MVVINPAYVWGPPAAPELITTHNLQRIRDVLMGRQPFWTMDFPVCDCRDVASVAILVAEEITSRGRYLVTSRRVVSPRWIAQVIRERFPHFYHQCGAEKVLAACTTTVTSGPSYGFDNRKIMRDLGYNLRDPLTTFTETIDAIMHVV